MASQQLICILMLFVCLADSRTLTKLHRPSTDSLKLLHVVFRHGDRTQDSFYPNDPHQNETFYPVGVGHLTNAGKLREYNIGAYLRETYDDFLDSVYSPGVVQATSSYYPRCKASLQLVLAGLFPPADILRWHDELNWQPIPYDYLPESEDLLFWAFSACSKYNTYYAEYLGSETYQGIYENYTDVLEYLKENSGIQSKTMIALRLYSILKSQQAGGLELPSWTDSVWPEPITTITKLDWQSRHAIDGTRALGAGFLLSKIVNDTQLTIDGDSSVENTQIYLYSGHDSNIAAVLSWLGIDDLHIPEYGSFVVFEIHDMRGIPFIRIVNQNYEYDKPQLVEIPNCGFDCPFATFVELYSQYLNPYEICN